MSSDLERTLRDAREALARPGEARPNKSACTIGRLARREASPRRRVLVLAGAMLVAAVAFGVTAGSLSAPTGTAAPEPAVPRLRPRARLVRTAVTASSDPGSADGGCRSQRPIRCGRRRARARGAFGAAVLDAPAPAAAGIVIVSTMTPETKPHLAPSPTNPVYPRANYRYAFATALRTGSGAPQVRPGPAARAVPAPGEDPQLRRRRRRVLRQLAAFRCADRRGSAATERSRRASCWPLATCSRESRWATASSCTHRWRSSTGRTRAKTSLLGGLYQLKSRAHAGIQARLDVGEAAVRHGRERWLGRGQLTGLPNAAGNSLAWISAGTPSFGDHGRPRRARAFPVLSGGTLGRELPGEEPVAVHGICPVDGGRSARGRGRKWIRRLHRLWCAQAAARPPPGDRAAVHGAAGSCADLPRDECAGP